MTRRAQSGASVANVSRIIAQYPAARNAYQHPAWQPYLGLNRFHWNEPLFGYYKTTDRWVLRRHAEMLADAGVDLVVFDCTNGTLTWKESYDILGQVWTDARRDGVRTPQIAFLCPFAATDASRISITSIYADLYKPGRFKGVPPPRPVSAPRTIAIDAQFDDWEGVLPEFRHYAGSTQHRDARGYGQLVYTNTTGRNDLVAARVARDASNVYFYVETDNAITRPAGRHWMMLLIDADRDHTTGWEGYDFVVNRLPPENGKATLETSASGWDWRAVGQVAMAHAGNRLELCIARTHLGLADKVALDIELKWNDNLQTPGDILDFYQSGDTAPSGRFNYRYHAQ